jgi:DNA-binding response OmpR family regulator
MKKLLVVAENTIYPTKLIEMFRAVSYNVHAVTSRLDGIAFFLQNVYDIVLVVSPETQPMKCFLERVKQLKSTIHTGFITESSEDSWCISMLPCQTAFYFSKDGFTTNEVGRWEQWLWDNISRAKTRRDILSGDDTLYVDVSARAVYQDEERVKLNIKEYRLLVCLLKNKGNALSRAQLYKVMQRNNHEADVRIVDKYIKHLRDKLGTSAIVSVRGYGYKWMHQSAT